MQITKITLRGFKSFSNSTCFKLSKGISAIVGPNGSGKSNVVDALAWVMGEQGPSSLRGSKMEDVIFAGATNASPLGRAEVNVTLDNTSGTLASQYSEISLSRVLYRNGVSEYSINGEKCRLLDVQELLSDAGLGREMHSIVGQGQLDRFLTATPLDRRAFIEEAAGVLKYRRRREKTERKIDAMEANLVRLQDLIAEVKRNLRPLGRQAETAQQAKEIAAGLRQAKSELLGQQLSSLHEKLEIASQAEAGRKSEALLTQSQLDTSRGTLLALEAELGSALPDSARSRLFTLESVETSLRSSRSIATQRISMHESDPSASPSERLRRMEAELLEKVRAKKSLNLEMDSAERALSHSSKLRVRVATKLMEHEAKVEIVRLENEAMRMERARREGEKKLLEDAISHDEAALLAQTSQLERISADIEKLESSKRENVVSSSRSNSNLRLIYETARNDEQECRATVDKSREKLYELEKKRDYLAARHAALGQLLEYPDGSASLLQLKLRGIEGLVAESIRVQPGYERALAAALGSLADSVIARNFEAAVSAITHLKSSDSGRVELLISQPETAPSTAADSENLSLLSVIEAPRELQDFLRSVLVAQDLSEAAKLLKTSSLENPVVVTLEGDYLSRRIVKGGEKTEPSKVELLAERSQISEELFALGKNIDEANSDLNLAKNKQLELSDEAGRRLDELQQQDSDSAKKAEAFGRLIAQIELAQAEQERLQASISHLKSKLESDKALLVSLESEIVVDEKPKASLDEKERSHLTEALESARHTETQAQIKLGTIRERLAAVEREEVAVKQRLESAKQEKALFEEKLKLQVEETDKARRVLEVSDLALPLMERLIATSRSNLRELESKRRHLNTRVSELRSQISQIEARSFELHKSLQESEMKTYELKLQLQSIGEKIFDELSLTTEELLQEAKVGAEDREVSEEELRKAIRRAESRLSQLGAFNPLALEEFAASEERHKYLTEQLSDLNNARADLKGIIKDLDEKMNTTFLAAFEDTKKAFEEIFPILFPGGTGSISLTQPEGGQEAGVEVSVRPAGKRIERMSLLSGGERSLAAIALLIAIFKARPSPFYVLDEVEAALDDANLGRLLEVLETLRETSQLIIVTHQKRTMEIADSLFGVSMGKDGITRVVGQKLDKAS